MKKNYQKPSMKVIEIQYQCGILAESVTGIGGNGGFDFGGGGSGINRAPGIDQDDWDEE